jgi:hypothetical protein
MAFVKTPLQKYSVPFLVDDKTGKVTDHYDYSLIRYLARRWREPFHNWTAEWSKRRMPHARFGNVGRNDPCPCESGLKYKKCCALEDGVLRPHCEFVFEVRPRSSFSRPSSPDARRGHVPSQVETRAACARASLPPIGRVQVDPRPGPLISRTWSRSELTYVALCAPCVVESLEVTDDLISSSPLGSGRASKGAANPARRLETAGCKSRAA